jgi:hypothetical protein
MTFTGASLPKDGVHSLTDAGAVGFPPGTPSISSGVNSPTNLLGNSGSVNVPPPVAGDYNGDHLVNAADYVIWRDTLGRSVTAGHGADGSGNGIIDTADYDFWRSKFGNAAGSGSGLGSALATPEPAAVCLVVTGVIFTRLRRRRNS